MIWVLLRNNRPLLLAWQRADLVPFLRKIENARIKRMSLRELFDADRI
jgi:hypothetical protein